MPNFACVAPASVWLTRPPVTVQAPSSGCGAPSAKPSTTLLPAAAAASSSRINSAAVRTRWPRLRGVITIMPSGSAWNETA